MTINNIIMTIIYSRQILARHETRSGTASKNKKIYEYEIWLDLTSLFPSACPLSILRKRLRKWLNFGSYLFFAVLPPALFRRKDMEFFTTNFVLLPPLPPAHANLAQITWLFWWTIFPSLSSQLPSNSICLQFDHPTPCLLPSLPPRPLLPLPSVITRGIEINSNPFIHTFMINGLTFDLHRAKLRLVNLGRFTFILIREWSTWFFLGF